MLARIAVLHALNRSGAIPFNRAAKRLHRSNRKAKIIQPVLLSKRRLNLGVFRQTPSSKEVKPTLREPTARQIEIFRLRCQGLSYAEIGRRFGIRRNSAYYAARTAATRLIRARPTLESAADRALALVHFPEIAKRFSPTE